MSGSVFYSAGMPKKYTKRFFVTRTEHEMIKTLFIR